MFHKHTIIHTDKNSINLLVVDVNYQHGKIAYFDLNQQPKARKSLSKDPKRSPIRPSRVQSKPLCASIDEFNRHISKYDYLVEKTEYQNGLYIPKQLPKLERDRIISERKQDTKDRYSLIAPIVEDDEKRYEYLYTNLASHHIKTLSLATGVNAVHIARLLSQYFYRGACLEAMYPNYRYCGCNYQPISDFSENSPKRGRNTTSTAYRNRLPEDEKNIEEFLRRLGKKMFNRIDYTQMYRLYDFYYQSVEVSIKGDDGVKTSRKVPKAQSDSISYQMFYYYIKLLEKNQLFSWSKNGERHFLREYESRFGRARDGVYGPSFRYEIDATLEDVYLIFPYFLDQKLTSGRPTTYRVSCVYSGMVVGIHVGIGGPNWQGVLQAIYNACTDKVKFCALYGITINFEQWPCDVVCSELTIDNGVEYPSKNMATFLDAKLGVDCINYTAIYSGKSKGGVEGGFQVDKREVVQFMPGYVERMPEKGAVHSSQFARYTYREFVQLLIAQTLIRNNEVFKNNIHDQVMSEQGVASTSLAVWNFGMKHYMNNGRGKRFPESQLMFALLPSGQAATNSRGIKFKGLFYSCPFAHSKGWLTDSKRRTVKKLDVRYFDGDTNQIWYQFEDQIYTAQLNDHSEIYRNRSWFDALHRLKLYDKERVLQAEKEREARFKQQELTSDISQQAKDRLKNSKPGKSKSPKKGISTLKYLEKKFQDHKTSSLLRTVLGKPNESGSYDLTPPNNTNAYKQSQQNTLNKMYGENHG